MCLLFADDLKLFMVVKNHENQSHLLHLQYDLNQFIEWVIQNGLHINIDKCKQISFYRKRNPLISEYVINNEKLERVRSTNH